MCLNVFGTCFDYTEYLVLSCNVHFVSLFDSAVTSQVTDSSQLKFRFVMT